MDLHELDERIDRMSIQKQLQALLRCLTEAKNKLEIANHLWQPVVAAEELLNSDESKLFDAAADALMGIHSLVGYRAKHE